MSFCPDLRYFVPFCAWLCHFRRFVPSYPVLSRFCAELCQFVPFSCHGCADLFRVVPSLCLLCRVMSRHVVLYSFSVDVELCILCGDWCRVVSCGLLFVPFTAFFADLCCFVLICAVPCLCWVVPYLCRFVTFRVVMCLFHAKLCRLYRLVPFVPCVFCGVFTTET